MKQTRTTLKELTAMYRAVLRHGILCNAIALGLIATATPAVATPVASVGDVEYETLVDAMTSDAARGGTKVKLLDSVANGSGLSVASGATNLTVDLNGKTYTAYGPSVGSTGTQTQLFQLLRDSNITFKNGTLNVAANKAENGVFKMVLQNYSNMNLDNVVVDGTKLVDAGTGQYVVSNNNGIIHIKDSEIIAANGDYAFDVYSWKQGTNPNGYGDVSVTVDNSKIVGKIEVTSDGTLIGDTKHELTINGGEKSDLVATNGASKIYNEGTTTLNNVTMSGNSATNGAAVYNTTKAATRGGEGIAGRGILNVTDSTFTGNTATSNGGAIYNAGTLTVSDAKFERNSATGNSGAIAGAAGSTLTLNNVAFSKNSAGWGGAMVARGTTNITGGSFTENSSNDGGGAIYLATLINKGHKLNINGTEFTSNSTAGVDLDGGGAIGSFSDLTLKNATFTGNHVDGTASNGGGALFLGSVSTNDIDNTTFTSNTSATNGGAISMRFVDQGNNAAATLDITNSTFTSNHATDGKGGAIYNTFHNDKSDNGYASVSGSTFASNEATSGGAIYNEAAGTTDKVGGVLKLTDSTFTGNTATFGGAVYNAGTLALAGTNTFTGNTAGGSANDIYNNGTLNIVSGETTIDGGITGTGALTIANGATLNIGRATISQQTIILEGTLIADVVEGGDYILGATNSFDGNGTLSLAIEKAGTYKLFNDKVFARAQEQITSTLYELDWSTDGGKTVIATTKSADKIASETGIEKETAAVVSNIAQSGSTSDSSSLREMAIKMQQSLAANDTISVEHAAAALHPEKEVVKQSVTSSVQNTVMNLAATRMIAAAMGHNGGDVDLTATGVWAQGLYNKTKMNGHFDGHTLGIAAGVDGTINNDFTVGLGYAFNHSEVSPVSRDIDIDSHTVFVYGQYKPSDWYVNAVLNYTFADYDESGIALGTPVSASYDANAFGGQVVTGYNFAGGITPEFGLRYLHINGSDYTNNIGIKNELKSADYLTAILGTRYGFNIAVNEDMAFRPELRYAIKYDMISDKSSAVVAMPGIASYTMNGDRLSRVGAELGIGVTMSYQELNVSLNYDIDIREDYTSQTGMLKLRYEF